MIASMRNALVDKPGLIERGGMRRKTLDLSHGSTDS
jgi:hypothetical protein